MKKIMFSFFKKKKAVADNSKKCKNCRKYQTLECPNSYYCFDTKDKPYYERKE